MNPFEFVMHSKDKVQYTSIERVIEMVYRDYKFIQKVNISDAIEWIGSVYGRLNYPGMYRRKITGVDSMTPNVTISQYRGSLPVDFRKVLHAGVRDYDSKEVYRVSSGTFTEFQYDTDSDAKYANTDKVYTIKGGYIFTETESATLEIAYEAFPIDDRGYPLVPDNEQVLEYAKEIIAEKTSFNLYAAGKISKDIWDTLDKRRMWRAGSAHTSLINPTAEEMETWTWSRLKLIPRIAGHDNSYSTQANREDLVLGTNLE